MENKGFFLSLGLALFHGFIAHAQTAPYSTSTIAVYSTAQRRLPQPLLRARPTQTASSASAFQKVTSPRAIVSDH
jgi:hypothetical protein